MSYYRCDTSPTSEATQCYVVKVGTGAGTYDITKIYTDYKKLTSNNFIVTSQSIGGVNAVSYHNGWSIGHGLSSNSYARPSKNYNSSTGILTVAETRSDSGTEVSGVGGYVRAQPEDIYLVVGL